MKKYCKALVNLGVAFIILLLIVFLVPKLLVFFAPFVAGWIIALIASPLVRFFEEKVKIKRKAGSAFVIVAVIALVILILYLVGAKLTDEIMGLIGALPDIWDSAENDFADIGQNLSVIYNRFPADVQQSIMDVINQIGSYVGDLLGRHPYDQCRGQFRQAGSFDTDRTDHGTAFFLFLRSGERPAGNMVP